MKIKERTFSYVITEAKEGGYIAQCFELPQVHTEGETLKEVKKSIRDALNLAMDYLREKAKQQKGEIVEITIR